MDIGQGDGIYIHTPAGKHILIDAGPDARRGVLPFLRSRHIDHIDVMLLTHPHSDHIGGAVSPREDQSPSVNSVLKYCQVGEVLDSGKDHPTPEYRELLEEIEKRGIRYRQPRTGEKLLWDPALDITVLHPDHPDYDNVNDNSIMIRLVYNKISFVFTGDGEAEAEAAVLSNATGSLKSDVLKVGHHGSRTSTSPEFLEAVHPRYALISCGAHNSFRHPRPETLEKLEGIGAKILRTDLDGFLLFKTDGQTIRWSRSPTPFPILDFDPGPPVDIASREWTGMARSGSGEVTLTAEAAGEEVPGNQLTDPYWARPLPPSQEWSCAVSMIPPKRWKMGAGLLCFGDKDNFIMFGVQDGRMASFTVVRKGNIKIGPEQVVAGPSQIGFRRTAEKFEALGYDDEKQKWRVFWTISKKEMPVLGDNPRVGVYAKSWRDEAAVATFKSFRMKSAE